MAARSAWSNPTRFLSGLAGTQSSTLSMAGGPNFIFGSYPDDQQIRDLTSGFRIVNRAKFLKFLYLLPHGFSYPTTITMSFFRAGFSVAYIDIEAGKRE